jgi:lipid A 4'-phosphatase
LSVFLTRKIEKYFDFGSERRYNKRIGGRARPRDIDLFGGSKAFSLPLEISNQCAWDCSFMSGHTAVAFWLLAPALLAPKKFRSFAVAAALLFGMTTAVFRIGQGAHFFSDVAFSALVMSLLIVAVYRRLF